VSWERANCTLSIVDGQIVVKPVVKEAMEPLAKRPKIG
jgi:hypothetical protein